MNAPIEKQPIFLGQLIWVGDQLGLYDQLERAGPLTFEGLCQLVPCNPEFLSDWLTSMVRHGLVSYDLRRCCYAMPKEAVAFILCRDGVYLARREPSRQVVPQVQSGQVKL